MNLGLVIIDASAAELNPHAVCYVVYEQSAVAHHEICDQCFSLLVEVGADDDWYRFFPCCNNTK